MMKFVFCLLLPLILLLACVTEASEKSEEKLEQEDSVRQLEQLKKQEGYYRMSCKMLLHLGLQGVDCDTFSNVNEQNYWVLNVINSEYSPSHSYKLLAQFRKDTFFYTKIEYDLYAACFSGPNLAGKDYDSLYSWASEEQEGAKDYLIVYSVKDSFFIPPDHFKRFMNAQFWELASVQEEPLRRPFWEIIAVDKNNKKHHHTIYAGAELASCVEIIIKESSLPFD
ncbi:hypothetical protein [Saprospira grandis]|nr:hypothetical protein [Saprospira grandis]